MKVKNFPVLFLCSLLLGLPFLGGHAAAAETPYPCRSIELVVGFTAGGQFDLMNRILAKGLEKVLRVTVVPVNKPGAGGDLAATAVANSRPDGCTLCTMGDTSLVTSALLGRITFAREDFRIIGKFAFSTNVIAVNSESPWKNIQELMEYARKNPGLNYAHNGVGASPWIRAEYLNKIGDLKMRGVPFKGGNEVISAVLGKHVEVCVTSYDLAKTQAEAGKMRTLMCFDPPGLGPDPSLPTIPSIFGNKVPNIDPVSDYLVAPRKTPEVVVRVLAQTLEKVTKDPEYVSSMKNIYTGIQFSGEEKVAEELKVTTSQIRTILESFGLLK